MSEYVQVQTYAKCNEDTFPTVLRQYRDVLERLGCVGQQVGAWLSQVSWPTSEDDGFGDIYASPFELSPRNAKTIACVGMDVSLYLYSSVPSLEEQSFWVGFNLLFDADMLKADATTVYRPGVGGTLWHILQELATSFPEVGVYFTNEWQENRSWRALTEGEGNPWAFDLAIFPKKLAYHFEEVPAGFQGTVVEQGFGFAREKRWETLPWVEAEQSS